jgi:hypothetical protein
MPMMTEVERAPARPSVSIEEARQVQVMTEALRAATLDAQRTLASLTQAEDGLQHPGSPTDSAREHGSQAMVPRSMDT